jgi:hypothetical protein
VDRVTAHVFGFHVCASVVILLNVYILEDRANNFFILAV